jgi:hypothetical protein
MADIAHPGIGEEAIWAEDRPPHFQVGTLGAEEGACFELDR